MTDSFWVTTIGSCRVENACRVGQTLFPFTLQNRRLYGLVHCTKEIIQQIRHMRDEIELPRVVAPFFCGQPDFPEKPAQAREADLFIVEICSQKEVMLRDRYLQLNHIYQHFRTRLDLLSAFYRYGRAKERQKRLAALAAVPAFAECNDLEMEMLTEATVAVQSYESLCEDVAQIRELLQAPAVYVTHCDVVGRNGKRIEERHRLVEWLEHAGRELEVPVHNPNELIRHFGQKFAMAEQGSDVNHYSPVFERILACELYDRYIGPMIHGEPSFGEPAEIPNVATLLAEGEAALAIRDMDRASERLRRACFLDPENPRVAEAMARASLTASEDNAENGAGKSEPPERSASHALTAEAVAESNGWPRDWQELAETAARHGDWRAARDAARQVKRLPTRSWDSRVLVATVEAEGGAPAAEALWREIAAIDAARLAETAESLEAKGLLQAAAYALLALEGADEPAVRGAVVGRLTASLSARARDSEGAGDIAAAYRLFTLVQRLSAADREAMEGRNRTLKTLRTAANDHVRRDELADAVTLLRQLHVLLPDDGMISVQMGRALLRQREWQAASEIWRDLALRDPTHVEARLQLARALDRSDQLIEAAGAWRRLLALVPDHPVGVPALTGLRRRILLAGRSALATDDLAASAKLFAQILPGDPEYDEAQRRLDQVRRSVTEQMRSAYKAGRFDDTLEKSQVLPLRQDWSLEMRVIAARSAYAVKDYPLALDLWREVAMADPQATLPQLQIARSALRAGAINEGISAAEAVLAREANAEAVDLLALLQRRRHSPAAVSA